MRHFIAISDATTSGKGLAFLTLDVGRVGSEGPERFGLLLECCSFLLGLGQLLLQLLPSLLHGLLVLLQRCCFRARLRNKTTQPCQRIVGAME
jgi:hypothetical protein